MSICSVVWEGIWIFFSNNFTSPSSPLNLLSLAVSAYEPGSETRVRLTILRCRVKRIWWQDMTLMSDPQKSRVNYPEAVMKSWQCGQMNTQGESMFGIAVWLIVLCGTGKASHQSTGSRVSRLGYAITFCSLKCRKISEWWRLCSVTPLVIHISPARFISLQNLSGNIVFLGCLYSKLHHFPTVLQPCTHTHLMSYSGVTWK